MKLDRRTLLAACGAAAAGAWWLRGRPSVQWDSRREDGGITSLDAFPEHDPETFQLFALGIFDNPEANLSEGQPSSGADRAYLKPSEEAYIGRGRTYYRFAYSYSQQIHGRHTPITEVLEKLSEGFDKYTRILAHMRGEYLDLLRRLSRGEIYHLERVVNESQREEKIKEKQDQVLDLYLEWKSSRDETL